MSDTGRPSASAISWATSSTSIWNAAPEHAHSASSGTSYRRSYRFVAEPRSSVAAAAPAHGHEPRRVSRGELEKAVHWLVAKWGTGVGRAPPVEAL